jgi:hypothetical protein
MGYFFGCGNACSESGGGGSGGGKFISVNLAAGETNNLNPGSGWPTGYGRLDLVPAGAASLSGLAAGTDGQQAIARNNSTQVLQLLSLNGGSSAANQFSGGGGGTTLPPLASCNLTYYAGTINKWIITT